MRKQLTYFTATVWYTVDSVTENYCQRKCMNADTDTEAYVIAERLHRIGAYDIRIRKASTNDYVKFSPTTTNN